MEKLEVLRRKRERKGENIYEEDEGIFACGTVKRPACENIFLHVTR